MTSKFFRLIFALLIFSYPFASTAHEIKQLDIKTPKQHVGEKHEGEHVDDRIICVDGLKVFQSAVFGFGVGAGTSVSNIQLYEEKDGKVVPARCK